MKYKKIKVSEIQLEDLVRRGADLIESGLKYVDHQRGTDRGPLDVLMVDSGSALVVAELKVVEDDGMLLQGIDYYDYIVRSLEAMARVYKNFNVDPKQQPRLFLIAPSFSVNLLNRCKWINVPISLFTYQCIEDEKGEITPVFTEITAPSLPPKLEVYSIEDRINYIGDPEFEKLARAFLDELQAWDPERVLIEPIKYEISVKVSGKLFAYLCPRRKYFAVGTFNPESNWAWTLYPIKQEEDLENAKRLVKVNFETLK